VIRGDKAGRSRRLATTVLAAASRRPGLWIAATGVACAVVFALSLLLLPKADGRVVVGDAVHYFVYLRSLVFDGDLHFRNEYIRLYGLTLPPPPGTEWVFAPLPTGYTRNVMPIGTALVWMPLYLVATAVAWALHGLGLAQTPDGYSRALQASTAFSGILAATGGAWCSFRAARRLVDAESAIWATLAVWLGSSAIYYSLVSPTYSHACSMLATSLVVLAWVETRERRSAWQPVLVGSLVGFAALVRVQDVVFLALPLADELADALNGAGWRRAAWRAGTAASAAFAAFAPQMLAWSTLYGTALLVPQGSGFMRWSEPHLVEVLFSSFRGLFTWTPVLLLAVAGLAPLARRHRRVAVAFAAVLALSWYVNAVVSDWWAGEAFGARRFLSCFPIFVAGMASTLERWRQAAVRRLAIVALLVVTNGLLLFQYQLFLKGWRDIAPYPDDLWNLWLARFVVPFRVLARMIGG
jgi:hypothetical protein